MTHKIVFLDSATLKVKLRQPGFAHEWCAHEKTATDEIVDRLSNATIAITNKVPLRGEHLARLPALKMIAIAATGTDNIDLDYCKAHGIAVANIRNYARHAVPEHVFALILTLRRNILAYQNDVKNGLWQQSDQFCLATHQIQDLHGSTLGIIGYGTLGKAVALLAEAFGMRVLITRRQPGFVSRDELIRESDIISLHCPLTPNTRNIIGLAELRKMRRNALLINTARGGLVNEAALSQALREGWIAGAGLDVLSQEPPRDGNPLLDLNLPNLIITPHVAWTSDSAVQILADQLVDNIETFAGGKPQHLVT
jgi:glycerate dehydrogenase